jgi:hypothetical protein
VDHCLKLQNNGDITSDARHEIGSRYPNGYEKDDFQPSIDLHHTHLRFATDLLTITLISYLKNGDSIFEIAAKYNKTLNMLIKSHSFKDWDYTANRPVIF